MATKQLAVNSMNKDAHPPMGWMILRPLDYNIVPGSRILPVCVKLWGVIKKQGQSRSRDFSSIHLISSRIHHPEPSRAFVWVSYRGVIRKKEQKRGGKKRPPKEPP